MKSKIKKNNKLINIFVFLLICFITLAIIVIFLEINKYFKFFVYYFTISFFVILKLLISENEKSKIEKLTNLINKINEDATFDEVLNHIYHSFKNIFLILILGLLY